MQDDIEDGVCYLIEVGEVDFDWICLVGFSYGGYVVLFGMVCLLDFYKCVVVGGSVIDFCCFLDFKEDIFDEVNEYWIDLIGDCWDSEQCLCFEVMLLVNQVGMM